MSVLSDAARDAAAARAAEEAAAREAARSALHDEALTFLAGWAGVARGSLSVAECDVDECLVVVSDGTVTLSVRTSDSTVTLVELVDGGWTRVAEVASVADLGVLLDSRGV